MNLPDRPVDRERVEALKAEMLAEQEGGRFEVFWSPEDEEWVARHTASPSLSWLADDPEKALRGLLKVLRRAESYPYGREWA